MSEEWWSDDEWWEDGHTVPPVGDLLWAAVNGMWSDWVYGRIDGKVRA